MVMVMVIIMMVKMVMAKMVMVMMVMMKTMMMKKKNHIYSLRYKISCFFGVNKNQTTYP